MFCMFIIIFKLIVKDITLWGERERDTHGLFKIFLLMGCAIRKTKIHWSIPGVDPGLWGLKLITIGGRGLFN